MSLSITVQSGELEAALKAAPQKIDSGLREVLTYSAIDFENAVIGFTPVASAALRNSLTHEVSGSGVSMTGRVFSQLGDQVRVASVEHGARPHWAPIGPLKAWASLKFGDERAAYAVQRAIALRGTRAHGMFNRGFLAAAPRVQARVNAFAASLGRIV